MKWLNKFTRWQEGHHERMRKMMGISHSTHLWISFVKGLLIGLIITCLLTGCSSTNKVVANKQASSIQNIDAISKVLGCVFAPASEECQRLREEQEAAPEDYCTDDGCPEFEELSK
jgi:outer membrane murein-binding lipoprotein Lpp|tara:strand:- start:644 stop:991 length:348 start_codon:yes stop_codon:yes gene_type:complete